MRSLSQDLPRHVAIIMDGNGRWAQKRGWPRLKGHEQGAQSVQECLNACLEVGVEYLTLYAFSSENWKRPAIEVKGLMFLLEQYLGNKIEEMKKNGIRFSAIGRLESLPSTVQERLHKAMAATADNKQLTLTLALNYGSRHEIVDALKAIADQVALGKLDPQEINEELISASLYTAGMPDPDLLIRTSGEYRISNFLLWQLSYAEMTIVPKLWPDFKKQDLLDALEDYKNRKRRFGAVNA